MDQKIQLPNKDFRPYYLMCLWILGCSTPSSSPSAQVENQEKVTAQKQVTENFETWISNSRVQDGSILVFEFQPTKIISDEELRRTRVLFQKKELPFFEVAKGRFQTVVAIPYLLKPGNYSIEIITPWQAVVRTPFEVFEGQYKSETLKVDKKHVRPTKPSILRRIKKDQEAIGKAYKVLTSKKYWQGRFDLPIQSEFTSPFGSKRIYNGLHQNSHMGLDLRAAVGAPIYAPEAGKVVFAADTFYLGNMVILDHGYGVKTVYGHMSKLSVKKGQEVAKQTQLGLAGMTGRASGPHLHWMAVIHGEKVDPKFLTEVMR